MTLTYTVNLHYFTINTLCREFDGYFENNLKLLESSTIYVVIIQTLHLSVVGDAGDPGAPVVHGSDVGPLVGGRIVHLHAAHAVLAVEATGYVYLSCKLSQNKL